MIEVLRCSCMQIRGLVRVDYLTCKIYSFAVGYTGFLPFSCKGKTHVCGCLGGYVRPPPAATLPEQANQPFKRTFNRRGLQSQSACSCQEWWMSSSNEMGDNRFVLNSQALRSFSKSFNDCHKSGSALANWHKQRREWVGSQKPEPRQLREPVIRWSATYEDLLGTSRPFTEPVPLLEMVDFLVDVWEQEGLYG